MTMIKLTRIVTRWLRRLAGRSDTEYLLSSPKNAARLRKSIAEMDARDVNT